MMLRIEQYREAFVAIDGIPRSVRTTRNIHSSLSLCSSIMQVLNNGSVGFQVQYQLIFCLWVLTFNPNIAAIMTK